MLKYMELSMILCLRVFVQVDFFDAQKMKLIVHPSVCLAVSLRHLNIRSKSDQRMFNGSDQIDICRKRKEALEKLHGNLAGPLKTRQHISDTLAFVEDTMFVTQLNYLSNLQHEQVDGHMTCQWLN